MQLLTVIEQDLVPVLGGPGHGLFVQIAKPENDFISEPPEIPETFVFLEQCEDGSVAEYEYVARKIVFGCLMTITAYFLEETECPEAMEDVSLDMLIELVANEMNSISYLNGEPE